MIPPLRGAPRLPLLFRHSTLLTTVGLVGLAASARAEPTLELRVSGPEEVFLGDPESTSVDARGVIGMGPVVLPLADLGAPPVVSLLPDGRDVVVGTAGGGVLRVGPDGKSKPLMAADKLVVSALGRRKGSVLAATSPEGAIFELGAAGARPFADPSEKYVWALLEDGDGVLVATGEPGRVLRLSPGGGSTVVFEPGETHVRVLTRHPTRGVLAGGGQKGVVYEIGKTGKAFALYDSTMDEVTALAVDERSGDVYAAFVSETKKGSILPDKSIGAVAGDDEDASPVRGSEVVRIASDGHVDLLWTSRTDAALALALDAKTGRLLIATGTGPKGRGRLYGVETRDRDRLSLLARVEPSIASALVPAPSGGAFLVGTAPVGRLFRVGPGVRTEAVYVTVEQDLQRISRIGRLWFDAEVPSGASVELAVRTGNTRHADATWSDWVGKVRDTDGGPVAPGQARYAQIRATLRAAPSGAQPRLRSVHASVQRMNVAPEVTEVFMLERGVYLRPMPTEEEKEKTITVSAGSLDRLRGSGPERRELRARQGSLPGMMTASWKADDRNGDELIFRVELRNLDAGADWETMADGVDVPFHTFDSRAYPDGLYQIRVTASDRPSNAPDQALSDQNLTTAFLLDNTPPEIVSLSASAAPGGGVRVTAEVRDAASPLGVAHVSVNGGPWLALPAADGLLDAKREKLTSLVAVDAQPGAPKLAKGRNVVSVRVDDAAGNLTTRSASFELR
jgi:hypothetical protein